MYNNQFLTNDRFYSFVCAYIWLCKKFIQVIVILLMNFCSCVYSYVSFYIYWGYFKFVYEFVFLMYLVMDHMHSICYDFEHSSSISVTGRMINLCYITWFDFFFPPADYRTYLFVCSYIREMKIQMEKEDMHMTYDQFVHSSLYYQSKGTRFIYCISIFIFIFYWFPFFLLR